jgi:hypothetical protein
MTATNPILLTAIRSVGIGSLADAHANIDLVLKS